MKELKIAIQKSGRLNENSKRLLEECGIKFPNGAGALKTTSTNFPAEILFLRDNDIPQYVEQGVADAGIVGENIVAEKGRDIRVIEKLGFASCRLSIAIPREADFTGPEWFRGRKIATSYPSILASYMKKAGIEAETEEISGSVEIAPGIGLADAVCDIVSSGSTLMTNGLKEVITIMKSQAVLVANKNLGARKSRILGQLLFRIQAVRNARENKYILLNAPEKSVKKISAILPGIKSPTILPLMEKGWVSIHSVVREDDFWERIGMLKEAGAEGILVIPIEKMIR